MRPVGRHNRADASFRSSAGAAPLMAQAADDTVHRGDGHAGTLLPQPRSGAGDDDRGTAPRPAAELNGKRLAVPRAPSAFPCASRRIRTAAPSPQRVPPTSGSAHEPSPDSVPLRGDSCAGAGVLCASSLAPWSRAGSAAGAADIAVVKRRRAMRCGISRSGSAGGFGYNRQEERPICHGRRF